MRGIKRQSLSLASRTRIRRVSRTAGFALYFLAVATWLYHGFQPAPTSASDLAEAPSLVIPAIDLSAPTPPLTPADGRLDPPAQLPGAYAANSHKTFIIGHSSTIFSRLSELRLGDLVTYDDLTYRITDRTILEKSAIDMSALLADDTTAPTLILMTCAGNSLGGDDYTHRLILTARR